MVINGSQGWVQSASKWKHNHLMTVQCRGRQRDAGATLLSSLMVIRAGRCLRQLGLMGCQTGPDQPGTSSVLPGVDPAETEGNQAWGCRGRSWAFLQRLCPLARPRKPLQGCGSALPILDSFSSPLWEMVICTIGERLKLS